MARKHNYPGGPPWTDGDLATLRALYANTNNIELGALFGRTPRAVGAMAGKLGLSKSEAFMQSHQSRFKKGLVPWNKGAQHKPGGRCAETQFKPGNRPHTWVPIGSYRIDKTGTLQRKISDDPGGPHKRWRSVHELVWVERNGRLACTGNPCSRVSGLF